MKRLTQNCRDHILPVIERCQTPEDKYYALIKVIAETWKPQGYFGIANLMSNLISCTDEDGILTLLDRIHILGDDIKELKAEMTPLVMVSSWLSCAGMSSTRRSLVSLWRTVRTLTTATLMISGPLKFEG